jgi:hypothetical protein
MKRACRQCGQSLVESALVLAAFMGLLVGMATVGESLFVRETLADRAHMAARWGALNNFDPAAIRSVALYGAAQPPPGESAFFGLTPAQVDVANPGCPGPDCRVSVAIPAYGIRSVEPMESATPIPSSTPAAASPAP